MGCCSIYQVGLKNWGGVRGGGNVENDVLQIGQIYRLEAGPDPSKRSKQLQLSNGLKRRVVALGSN